MSKKDILNRLNELTKSYSFIYILSLIVLRDFCGTIDNLFSKNVREHLNDKELSFLIGLWLKNIKKDKFIESEDELQNNFEEVYTLMDNLHFTFLEGLKNINPLEKLDIYEMFSNGPFLQETMIYSGTGAYDVQYKKLSSEKYKYDKEWFLANKEFDVDLFEKFYDNIKDNLQNKLNNRKLLKAISDYEQVLNIFCLSKIEITKNDPHFENILNCLTTDISLKNNTDFNYLGDFNIFSEKPIIKIKDDCYFIPSSFSISESLYESPFYWMLQDANYKKIALKNRGDIAEELTTKMLEPVFGKSNIYQNVIIKKNKTETVSDIDVLALHNDKAIIFQIKSKKLTALSKQGNIESIKDDFKKAVQDAYEQGNICKQCLIDNSNFIFLTEYENFEDKISKLSDVHIVTIVLDNYPGISHQVHILLGNKTEELPVSVNIFDLEILLKYLPKPDDFTDYIKRRIKFSKFYKADNEMCYLGFHLKKGIEKYDGDYIALDESWAQYIDKTYYKEIYKEKVAEFTSKKIQRNDPCFCLSGLKYKKCHGRN
ncbi:SEC-C metal-binding domain-containing protein [Flavobacterium tibetense]|nr:SEC-C metal-binding domain-containing protein [Flavobacterium tibetense]